MDTRAIFEEEILSRIMNDGEYFGAVTPYIKPKYFNEVGNSIIFKNIQEYYVKTGMKPNTRDLVLLIKDEAKSSRDVAKEALKKILSTENRSNEKLLINKTEEFIRRAIHTESLILGAEAMGENNTDKLNESFRMAEEAQKVSLDDNFGVSVSDIDHCIEYYQDQSMGLLPGIGSFDKMLGRGFREKTLHTFLAPPGIGKSATMAAFATEFLKQKKDIIIFTLEMDEAEWMKRIYSNLLDIDIFLLETIDPIIIKKKWDEIKPFIGTLTVKEYPSYTLKAMKVQSFIEKYMIKTGIKEPIVFVDYLGLMDSGRVAANSGSYEYIKSITAELRSVAQTLNITIFTAHQLNRGAVGNLEAGQETVSDSAGISMFSDSMMFLLQTKEMKNRGEIMVNFEKNRMTGKTYSFKIGFDYNKMRFEDKFFVGSTGVSTHIPPGDLQISTGLEELGMNIPQDIFN